MSERFNAQEYWGQREKKIFVVTLQKGSGQKRRRDTKYVRAKDRDGAVCTALFHTSLKRPNHISARLVTPWDLGCVETG